MFVQGAAVVIRPTTRTLPEFNSQAFPQITIPKDANPVEGRKLIRLLWLKRVESFESILFGVILVPTWVLKCLRERIQILPFVILITLNCQDGWVGVWVFNFYVSDGRNLPGNEKLPWDGLDQRQEYKDDKESAIMSFVVATKLFVSQILFL